jgi:hypothetical protein
MERIINNGPKLCSPHEKEYLINLKDWKEIEKFSAFMKSLGYKRTGVNLSDIGKTIIFY